MALSIQLGFPDVPKSITNPSVNPKDALDVEFPYPFLKFIKLINVSFEPDVLYGYYKEYANVWYRITTGKTIVEEDVIVQQYKDFLRELALNFTTEEEKIFLTKIDFNDPYDLDVAMGFFGKKLRDITTFYNNKRHNIKSSITRNKIRGTNLGLERYVVDLVINHLRNLDDGKVLYNYAQIQEDLIVEIEELYDQHPFYFNQPPDQKIYDNKDLDYGLNLFLNSNSQLISALFLSTPTETLQLKELVPLDPINPSNNVFDNKRALTEANVFANFYFLSTGNTVSNFISGTTLPCLSCTTTFSYTSGQLFESTHDLHAFLNRDWPTTASTEEAVLKTPRQQGFFKPSKLAIVLVDGQNSTFFFNITALSPNSLYFFPDPNIFGKNGDVLTFIVDDTFLKKNITSGKAVNQPTSTPYDTKYYGYVSKIEPNENKYFDIIFDSGHVTDYKRDIYNNSFGLFSNDDLYKRAIEIIPEVDKIFQIWNGYRFFDLLFLEGYNFNYSTFDDTTDPIRSGLSTFTNGFFPEPVVDFEANFGFFLPELFSNSFILQGPTIQEIIFENAFIMDFLEEPYAETFSSDLEVWSTTPGFYYYSHLIENGIAAGFVRPLFDPLFPNLSANITEFSMVSTLSLSGDQFAFIDGDTLGNFHEFEINLNIPSYSQTNIQLQGSEFFNLTALPVGFDGHLFVKNSNTDKVLPLLEAFPYFNVKYSLSVLNELDNVIQNFDTAIDILFIETPNYLVIEKIVYENSQFVNPNLKDIVLSINTNWANVITNRFKKDTDVFYAIWNTLTPTITSGQVTIYPTIYRYNILTNSNDIIFNTATDFFTLSLNPSITNVTSTTLTYNSRNDIYRLSFIGKGPMGVPTLVEFDYTYRGGVVEFLRRNIYNFSSGTYSYFFDTVPTTLFFYMSSSPITIINSEFVF